MLYRILTGTVPLDALTRINNDTMPEPARVNPQVPPRVSKVLMKGLAVRGEERIQTITELVTASYSPATRISGEFAKPAGLCSMRQFHRLS